MRLHLSKTSRVYHTDQRGSAFLLTLFFSAMFLMMFGAVLSFIVTQHKAVQHEVWKAQALHAAEGGVQYYRWHLSHNPTEFTEDTGARTFLDSDGQTFAPYTLTVTEPAVGSTIVRITANATPEANTNIHAIVSSLYGKPSLAHYAFLTNSNVWFGDTENISGEIHSNGGIRMDGTGDSVISSEQLTYICGSEHGCSDEEKDGVWGTGQIPELWSYPTEHIDFDGISAQLSDVVDEASVGGIDLPDSGALGYYIVFSPDDTLTVNTVTSLYSPVYGYDGTAWVYESIDKKTWTPLSGYTNIPIPENGIIHVADDTWVSGSVSSSLLLYASRDSSSAKGPASIYIQESITYDSAASDPSLGLISQQDILIPLRSEDNLSIDAALVAIGGHAFRYYYPASSSEPYKTYALRDRIETYGTIITNTLWTWSWVSCDTCPVVSGYSENQITYDPNLRYSPPPGFPTQDEYAFISWEEQEINQ
ncbi:MAG: hypothetical protein COW24_05830 [Candidatus Kerfeldbacteria bacterium CG15_BIG_FIL_POST_REV_8_21_14_020_45_12]|uniref:Uncharacterized protein n=1 Tax=Candidatus Kerfeldbacteria bacterium CG15_BIG_FIL_POST_REV_8_21_14_020_45_12 TaxID=2014247 RepID=A0A2M7H291_9BACT|nr:MAG: hypothetical protein COW24_05830 [Candidatus Kerfeldbacteria bacterium CG15_BIG_FIL_POST_REV_8_21_14_020_45_12]PJA93727.1 MAG: hypothetical protein CO132_01655 [Candidatus Kerfeldbacteria bacterium CG_4_9_14_3_um_filter_45_8]